MVFSACLDTCVLVPSLLRDVLLEIAQWKAYRPVWSSEIEAELHQTIIRLRAKRGAQPDESGIYIKRLSERMNTSFPDARVDLSSNQITIDKCHLSDPNDAHVIKAAILGQAAVIVTFNLKDFPNHLLPNGLFAQSPDDFLTDLLYLEETESITLNAITTVSRRSGRKGPRLNEEDMLIRLGAQGLKQFASSALDLFKQANGSCRD